MPTEISKLLERMNPNRVPGFVYFYHVNSISGRNIHLFYVNRVDLDKLPHFAASDLGLHYLPMSYLWDTRH